MTVNCCFKYLSVIDENQLRLEKAHAVLEEAIEPLEKVCEPDTVAASLLVMQREHIQLLLTIVSDIMRDAMTSNQKALDQYAEEREIQKAAEGGDTIERA